MISIHDLTAIDRWARERKLDPGYLRRQRTALYKKSLGRGAAAAALPEPHRTALLRETEAPALTLAAERPSTRDGATKLIFRTAQGMLIEAVLLQIASGRRSLCISSQVGCAARCAFCATGKMGLAHNLSAAEIADQVLQANQRLAAAAPAARVRNIVLMGMGEPLHNEQQVTAAIELLTRRDAFHYSPRRIAVSTVGIPAAMVRLAQRFPQIRLALSLHAARESVRRELMPIARLHALGELRDAIEAVAAIGRQPVMIEYLLLAGVNDSDSDIEALIDYLHGLDVHVNLIPYNPIDGERLVGTPPGRRMAISARLKAAGFRTTLRYSLGADIGAACGQLVQGENRRVARPMTGASP